VVSVRISCSHYGLCALVRCDRLFKGSRIHESRSNKMYLAQYPFYIQDLSAEQLHYIRSCFYMCTMIILIVCGTSFRNTWKRIRRFEPIVAATTISRGSGRTSIWHRIKDCNWIGIARLFAESSDKCSSFRVTYPDQLCGSAYEAINQRWHKLLDAACREHDIAYSRSNDLTIDTRQTRCSPIKR